MKKRFAVDSEYMDCPALIIEGQAGYYPLTLQQYADLKDKQSWSKEVLDSAIAGSMFGWDTPAAKQAIDAAEGE